MPMPQHAVNPQYMAVQRPMPHPNDAALRRSRKPTDKNIPDGIEEVVIGEGVEQYKNLRDLEKRLDAAVVRKRLDIQDSISKTVKKYRTMRIWITNTVEDQPWQNTGSNPGSGRYKVRIEGRLLDDDNDPTIPESEGERSADDDAMDQDKEEGDKDKPETKKQPQRFSHFFKTVTVDFDKPATTASEEVKPITWNKPQVPANAPSPPQNAEFDSIQFSRSSQENLNVTVNLVRDETPERFKLSKELAEVLDVEEETRSGIVLGIWDYIRAMELQEDEEKRQVRCDHRLRSVSHQRKKSGITCPNKLNNRSLVAKPCSSLRFRRASAPTLAPWIPLSSPIPSVSTRNFTRSLHPQSTTFASPSRIPYAQR